MSTSQGLILIFFILPNLLFILASIVDTVKINKRNRQHYKAKQKRRLIKEKELKRHYSWEYNFGKQFENIVNF